MTQFVDVIHYFINFDINLNQPIPLWMLLVIITIAVIIAAISLLLKYSSNAIMIKTKFDDWKSSRKESEEQTELADNLEVRFFESQEEINKDAGFNVLPYHMKIRWQNRDDVKSIYGGKDRFWVVMKNREDQSENFVRFVETAIEQNLAYRTRRYLSEPVKRAIELTMIKKIVSIEWEDALEYYDEKLYKPDIQRFQYLNEYVEGLTDLDAKGLFVRSYLREIHDYGKIMFPKTATPEIKDELREFTSFFSAIGKRRGGEHIQLKFEGKTMRTGVVFVAGKYDEKTIWSFTQYPSSSPQSDDITDMLNENIHSIYIFARGTPFMGLAIALTLHFANDPRVNKTYQIPFTDRDKGTKAIICIIRTRKPHN